MSNWDHIQLNQPDPHEAVQRYHAGKHAPITLGRILIWLLVIAGISMLPMIILFCRRGESRFVAILRRAAEPIPHV